MRLRGAYACIGKRRTDNGVCSGSDADRMFEMMKRFFAAVLCLCLMFALLPATALALTDT